MNKIVNSHHYRTIMYFIFSLGIFFTLGVKACHGGILGERFIPVALNYGWGCFTVAGVMWLLNFFNKHEQS